MADRRLLQRSMAVCCKYCWVCCSSAAHGRDMLKSSGRPSIPGISQQNHWNIITISIKCTTNNNFLKFYSDLKNKSFGITETWILILEPTSSNSVHIVIICRVVHVITILILSIWNKIKIRIHKDKNQRSVKNLLTIKLNHQYKSIYCSTLFLNILLVCIGIHLLMHLCPHDWGHSCPHGDEVSTWGIVVLGGGRGWWKRPKSTKTQPLKINPGNSEILDKIHEKICGVINSTNMVFFCSPYQKYFFLEYQNCF